MVDNYIGVLDQFSRSMETKKTEKPSKLKRYITEFTEIKRPPGKVRSSCLPKDSLEKSATLPRRRPRRDNEGIKKQHSLRGKQEQYMKDSRTRPIHGILKHLSSPTLPQPSFLHGRTEANTSQSEMEVFESLQDLTLLDSTEDIFGLNDFDSDDNYIIETYNLPGQELIITTLEVTRTTITKDSRVDLSDLINDSDYVFHKEESLSDTENGTVLKKFGSDSDISYASINIIDEVFEDPADTTEVLDNNHTYENNTFENVYSNLNEFLKAEDAILEVQHERLARNSKEYCNKIKYVIDELIKTEEYYVKSLNTVVDEYMPYLYRHTPHHLVGRTSYLFGNIKVIFERAISFLSLLQENSATVDGIGQTFIDLASIFELYPQYSKNKPTADIYLKEFEEIIKTKQNLLGDKLGLASHLLTPIQRLGKYILLLEKIQKELKKEDRFSETIEQGINIIRKAMRTGNDYIAIDSIKECKIDLTLHGSFIMRATFNIIRPRKCQSMIFLFENIIVFTERVAKNVEQFRYFDSIEMSDLSLAKFEDNPCIFHLWNYPKRKRQIELTYVLEAESPKLKADWTQTIEAELWSQLEKAKELQKRSPYQDFEFTELTEEQNEKFFVRPKSRSESGKKKRQSVVRSKSKFYDETFSISPKPK